MMHDLWRQLVFFGGKIRTLDAFPWITWAADDDHIVTFDEIASAMNLIRYGDIGLHRYAGYLSNVVIPGFMIHAWVHTEDGYQGRIVEAVRQGVVHRSAIYPMFADYTIILRPKMVSEEERKGACLKAKKIVGSKYDVDFTFDIEDEINYFRGKDEARARAHLKAGEPMIKKYDPAFTCTEVAAYSWWHKREELGIERTEHRGKSVIIGDTFLNPGWEIVWMSRSVTADTAYKLGVSEMGLAMINAYINSRQ